MGLADQDDVLKGYESGPLIMRIGVWAILGGEFRCAVSLLVFSVVFGIGAGLLLDKPTGETVALALAVAPLSWWLTRSTRKSAILVPNDWSPWYRRPRPEPAGVPVPSKDHAVWAHDAVLLGPKLRVALLALGFVLAGVGVWMVAPLVSFVFAFIALYHLMVACSTLRAAGDVIIFRNFLSWKAVNRSEVEVFIREEPRIGIVRGGTRTTLWFKDSNGYEHRVMATMQAAFFDTVPHEQLLELQRLLDDPDDVGG